MLIGTSYYACTIHLGQDLLSDIFTITDSSLFTACALQVEICEVDGAFAPEKERLIGAAGFYVKYPSHRAQHLTTINRRPFDCTQVAQKKNPDLQRNFRTGKAPLLTAF